jgi:succinyl-CoA synthetase beta subunit
MEHEVFPLLSAAGIQVPPVRIVRRGDAVEPALAELTGPFVAKIVSSTIVHRRSAGGVLLNLDTPTAVSRAVADLFARFGDRAEAVLVEPMLKPDLELILGAKRSRGVGLAVMLGFGGTFVEDLRMLALRLSPIGHWDSSSLIERSGTSAALTRLAGTRALQTIEALATAIMRFDALCRGLGSELAEFDINPLGFYTDTLEFRALDAKIVLTRPGGSVS